MTWWYQWSWMICSGDLSVGALSSSRKVTSLIPSNTCWSLCMEFSMCLWPSDGLSRVWGRPPLMTPGIDSSFTLDPEKDWDVEDGWMNGWMEAWPGPPTHSAVLEAAVCHAVVYEPWDYPHTLVTAELWPTRGLEWSVCRCPTLPRLHTANPQPFIFNNVRKNRTDLCSVERSREKLHIGATVYRIQSHKPLSFLCLICMHSGKITIW